MNNTMEQLYQERLKRYTTAMRNEKPDRIPIRPLAAEFAGKYAGFNCQQVTHDMDLAFEAVRRCAADFNWDAVVGNMVYVWTGLVDTVGLNYYTKPGIDGQPDSAFQYKEPKDEENAYMRADEYDLLIEDPTSFLANVWMPRVNDDVAGPNQPNTYRNNLSWLKGGMGMLSYFNKFVEQNNRLRVESGTVPALAGCLKSPFDIIADKLRGYVPLCMDLYQQPDKVLAATEALMPHMIFNALAGADPEKNAPLSIWMHRGCVPFLSHEQFEKFYWPTFKQMIEEIWNAGYQVILYAEGDWDAHFDHFVQLPERSVIYHVDRGDIFEAHKKLGHKFCISGGIPNELLTYGTKDEVKEYCKKVIDGVAQDGGYIMDAGAIMQEDPKVENVRAMTDFTVEYGVY